MRAFGEIGRVRGKKISLSVSYDPKGEENGE
jgi:hypothetical protein